MIDNPFLEDIMKTNTSISAEIDCYSDRIRLRYEEELKRCQSVRRKKDSRIKNVYVSQYRQNKP